MNKKIKLSLFGFLFTTSTLVIMLPIVSCSISNPIVLIVNRGTDAQLTAIGTAIANFAKNVTNGNNTSELTPTQYNKALTIDYNDIRVLLYDYFSFKNGTNDVADEDAIEGITLTGNYTIYPTTIARAPFVVKIDVKLKDGYTAAANNLSLNVQIGISSDIPISVTKTSGTNDANLNMLGRAIANFGGTTTENNTAPITREQFNKAITATYADIKAAIDAYFVIAITNGGDVIDWAIDRIEITGTYTNDSSNVFATVKVHLKDGYTGANPNMLFHNVKIGMYVTPSTL